MTDTKGGEVEVEDIVAASTPLTPREAIFVHEFLRDLNAIEAAKRAGYKIKDDRAYALLEKANIRHSIHFQMQAKDESLDITELRIIEEIAALAFANVGDFIDWTGGSVMIRSKSMIKPSLQAAIAEITEVTLPNGMTTIRFKLHNKLKALEDLLAYTLDKNKALQGNEDDEMVKALTKSRARSLLRAREDAKRDEEDGEEAGRLVRESAPDSDPLDEALDGDNNE